MYRTPEEEKEYQKLSAIDKQIYNAEVNENPHASHNDCIQVVCAARTIRGMRTQGEVNINLSDNRVKKKFLENYNRLMKNDFPKIWASIKDTLKSAIEYLGDLIADGIIWTYNNVISPIVDFLKQIFDY